MNFPSKTRFFFRAFLSASVALSGCARPLGAFKHGPTQTTGNAGTIVVTNASITVTGGMSAGTSLNFGSIPINTSTTQLLTLTNQGTLPATGLKTTQLDAPFYYTGWAFPGVNGTCASTLDPGASCQIELAFGPPVSASYTGALALSFNNGAASQTVAMTLTGIGTLPSQPLRTASGFGAQVRAIFPTSDGGAIVAGDFFAYGNTAAASLIKLTSNLTPDPQFNTGSGFNGGVWDLADAGDGSGKVYAGGIFTSYNGATVNHLVRLNTDGSLDTSFTAGFVGAGCNLLSVVATPGGSEIYAALANCTQYQSGGQNFSINGVVRLNADGSLDTSFNSGGSGFVNGSVSAIAIGTTAGTAYFVGSFTSYNGTTANAIVRLNSSGTIDTTFATGTGFTVPPVLGTATLNRIAVVPSTGQIYVDGKVSSYNGTSVNDLVRLNSDGSLDSSFNPQSTSFTGSSIVLCTDGTSDIYIGNLTYLGVIPLSRVSRLHSDGSLNNSFQQFTQANGNVNVLAIAADGSGKVFAGGTFTNYNLVAYNRFLELDSSGTVDPNTPVGSGFTYPSGIETMYSILPLSNGFNQVLFGGYYYYYNGQAANDLSRINPDSTLDPSFSTGLGFNNSVRTMVPVPNGSGDTLVGGLFTTYDGAQVEQIVQVTSSGTINSSFSAGNGFGGGLDTVLSILPAPGGTGYFVGGGFTTYRGVTAGDIILLKANGDPDPSFNSGTGFDGAVNAMVAVNDGTQDIYAGGTFSHYNGVSAPYFVRLRSDGTLVSGYSVFNSTVSALAGATDGSGAVYVGGLFTMYGSKTAKQVARVTGPGTQDSSFSSGGFGGTGASVYALALATDGTNRLYVGGIFSTYQGTSSSNLVRLAANGQLDSTFSVGTGFRGGGVQSIAIAVDGSNSIYVGGGFYSYNGMTTDTAVHLLSDGTLN